MNNTLFFPLSQSIKTTSSNNSIYFINEYLYMMMIRLTNHNQSNASILRQHKPNFRFFRISLFPLSLCLCIITSDLHDKFATVLWFVILWCYSGGFYTYLQHFSRYFAQIVHIFFTAVA